MSDDLYDWWRLALAGVEIGSDELPINPDKPQAGFYRMKRGGHFEPVAIFPEPDPDQLEDSTAFVMIALVGGQGNAASHQADDRVWLRCCTNPVTEAAYREAVRSGSWADVHPAIYSLPAIAAASDRERLNTKLSQLHAEAFDYADLGVKTDIEAESAQSLRARILELVKEADLKREIEKRPHLEAGRRVDEAWRDMIGGGKEAAKAISKAVGAYLQKREIEGKANAPAPVTIKGGYGRAASVRDITRIDSVANWESLFAHYAADDRAQALILDLAQKDINKGIGVPFLILKTEKALR